MECPYCGTENRDGVRYCGNCGKKLGDSSTLTATPGGATSRSLAPGARLQGGRYVVKKMLGQGGMGTALLAVDLRLDSKTVVIKELISENVDPAKLQEEVRNFKREVATLAHIDHPLVPSVTDHFQEGTRYFMVQEYVEGENLEDLLARTQKPMPERDALICTSEVLDVLEYLAQQTPPIVHRDIKPANIIIGAKDRRAHLVDFGIARADEAKNAKRKQTSALGTPGYAPPEQYQGNADPRSDLYALAATLHHVLTNRDPRNFPPFNYPPVRTLNAQLSPEIERILAHALTNDIDQRYQSANAMRREIDDLLRQRFGISGNISTYMLGASGPIAAMPSSTMPGKPAGAAGSSVTPIAIGNPDPPTVAKGPASLPNTGPTVPPSHYPISPPAAPPPHYYQSMGQQGIQPPYAPGQTGGKRRTGLLIALALLLLAIMLIFFATFSFIRNRAEVGGSSGSNTVSAIGVTKIGSESIGISDGTIIFDSGRLDGSLKQQAADKLKQNKDDPGAAMALLREAISQDSNDAEALIYLENLRVQSSGSSYVTLLLGTMLSGDSSLVSVGRDDLQGAYVAQKEYNDGAKLHNGVLVRLFIANSGSQTSYITQVTKQATNLAKSDPTFVGVMGWPFSSRTVAAISTLGAAHIPLVSQTSSSNELTGISPYFFRVAPANKTQGVAGAQYAEATLHAKRVAMFVDPTDTYSQSLAQDFVRQFQTDGNSVVVTENYTVHKPATIPARLTDALKFNPDLIYFSGYSDDVSVLLTNLPSGTIPVMGGDALYELGGYPSSARANFSRLHFTAFAYPDEWDVLGYGKQKPAFFTEYPNAFDPNRQHTGSPYGFTRAANDVILSYDATVALLNACDGALKTGKKNITPEDVQQALKRITGPNSFQGVSGQIAFGPDGDPINKAIVILSVDPQGHIRMEPKIPGQGRFLL